MKSLKAIKKELIKAKIATLLSVRRKKKKKDSSWLRTKMSKTIHNTANWKNSRISRCIFASGTLILGQTNSNKTMHPIIFKNHHNSAVLRGNNLCLSLYKSLIHLKNKFIPFIMYFIHIAHKSRNTSKVNHSKFPFLQRKCINFGA